MMLKPLPHPEIALILQFLSKSHRYGTRNRCLYRLRLVALYKDIVDLRLGDVLTGVGTVVDSITLSSGSVLSVDKELAGDLMLYIRERYRRYDLKNFIFVRGGDHLFVTQKSSRFSSGWLAQLYSHLDRAINRDLNTYQNKGNVTAHHL